MKTLLYALHLSRRVKGMCAGPVHPVPAQGVLHDTDENGRAVVPDGEAIAQCLPHYYRKAWSRAHLSQLSGADGFHYDLRDRNGFLLNVVYATPCFYGD